MCVKAFSCVKQGRDKVRGCAYLMFLFLFAVSICFVLRIYMFVFSNKSYVVSMRLSCSFLRLVPRFVALFLTTNYQLAQQSSLLRYVFLVFNPCEVVSYEVSMSLFTVLG